MNNEINNSVWLQMKLLSLCQIVVIMQRIVMSYACHGLFNSSLGHTCVLCMLCAHHIANGFGDTERRGKWNTFYDYFSSESLSSSWTCTMDGIVSNSIRWDEWEVSFQPYYKWIKLHNIFMWWQKTLSYICLLVVLVMVLMLVCNVFLFICRNNFERRCYLLTGGNGCIWWNAPHSAALNVFLFRLK